MSLSRAPGQYSQDAENRFREELNREISRARKRGADLEIAGQERLIMASPNGERWVVSVADDGTIAAVAL